jgi:hypothetical protein
MMAGSVHYDAGWVSVRLVIAQAPPAMNDTESKLMSANDGPSQYSSSPCAGNGQRRALLPFVLAAHSENDDIAHLCDQD